MKRLTVFVDGGIAGVGHTGAAAVARTAEGYFRGWLSRQMPRMTNNEAEYRAALLGLELARGLGARRVEIVADSEVVVRQMRGLSRVNSARLKRLHQETCRAAADFEEVVFTHVSREKNRLADALAAEAIAGRVVRMPPATANDGNGWAAQVLAALRVRS